MRAVLDTNVLVSGLISPTGPCGQVIDLVVCGDVEPCVDGRILDEYEAVIGRLALRIPGPKASEFLNAMRIISYRTIAALLLVCLPDPTDLPFLEVAASAKAVLVTGNARHFPTKERGEVSVLSPAELLAVLRARS